MYRVSSICIKHVRQTCSPAISTSWNERRGGERREVLLKTPYGSFSHEAMESVAPKPWEYGKEVGKAVGLMLEKGTMIDRSEKLQTLKTRIANLTIGNHKADWRTLFQ